MGCASSTPDWKEQTVGKSTDEVEEQNSNMRRQYNAEVPSRKRSGSATIRRKKKAKTKAKKKKAKKAKKKFRKYEDDNYAVELRKLEPTLTYPDSRRDFSSAWNDVEAYPSLVSNHIKVMKRKQKLHIGDRTGLEKLDELMGRLTYPSLRKDFEEAEENFVKYPSLYKKSLEVMQRKEMMHLGQRDHKLRQLDALKPLTYRGWKKDWVEAEENWVLYPGLFDKSLVSMKKKQKMHNGDRSAKGLKKLDKLKEQLSYAGWEKDVAEAEKTFVEYPSLFDKGLKEMKKKQKFHDGDRSDKGLQKLDKLKKQLSYRGWKKDVKAAEKTFVSYPSLFEKELDEMRKKQMLHDGDRSDEGLQKLDRLKATLCYPGWKKHFKNAEKTFISYPSLFKTELAQMETRQKLYDGDRSAKELRELDELKERLCYPSWQEDCKKAEDLYVEYPSLFKSEVKKMRRKQQRCEETGTYC